MKDKFVYDLETLLKYAGAVLVILAFLCLTMWERIESANKHREALIRGLHDYARMYSVGTLLEPLHDTLSVKELEALAGEYSALEFGVSGSNEAGGGAFIAEYDNFYKQMEFKWYQRAANKGSACGQWHVEIYEDNKALAKLVGIAHKNHNNLWVSNACTQSTEQPSIDEIVCIHTKMPYWCKLTADNLVERKRFEEWRERTRKAQ